VVRDVTREECQWLNGTVKKGTTVYRYSGHVYGCIGYGVAVTLVKGETPFFELPHDSIKEVK
jgi:hypothetical protein